MYLARAARKRRHRRTYLRGIGRGSPPLSQQKKRPLKNNGHKGKSLGALSLLLWSAVPRTQTVELLEGSELKGKVRLV